MEKIDDAQETVNERIGVSFWKRQSVSPLIRHRTGLQSALGRLYQMEKIS